MTANPLTGPAVACNPQFAQFAQFELALVLFGSGGGRSAVEASQIRATRPISRSPADFQASDLLNFPADLLVNALNRPPAQLLFIKHSEQDRTLQVDAPVEIVRLSASAIHPLPPLLAARSQLRGLRALALYNNQLIPLFNLAALIEAQP